MITVIDLHKLHGKLTVLDGVSLTVNKGEVATVIGPSGGGKSTLLRCINGLETFEAGQISVGDLNLEAKNSSGKLLQPLRQRIGMVFQQFHLFPHMTALDNIMSGPRFSLGKSKAEAEAIAKPLLARVGLADKADSYPGRLSGGQQQRVAIARTLAVNPQVILFDEPTSALDPKSSNEVLAVMTDLARDGLTMIVVTHAMGFARKVSHTVRVMAQGKMIEQGPPDKIFGNPSQEITRDFLQTAERE